MKTILHLCASNAGSDSYIWEQEGYNVIKVTEEVGVENFTYKDEVFGIIANPPCTEFSTARTGGKARSPKDGMFLVEHCLRIIEECKPKWWVLENPARGVLSSYLGEPDYKYEPWWFGSPWTKKTALWGDFNIPPRKCFKWDDVEKNEELYVRPSRGKPSLAFLHKSAIFKIKEFEPFIDFVDNDMSFRSLCSQKFARAFYEANR